MNNLKDPKELLGKLMDFLKYLMGKLISFLTYLLETPPKELLTRKNLIIVAVVLVVGTVVLHPRKTVTVSSTETRLQEEVKAVDPKNLDVGKDIAKLFDVKEKLRGPIRGETMMVMSMFDRENQGQSETVRKTYDATAEKIAEEYEVRALENKALFFAQTFTPEELAELKDFYKSPVGQKLIKVSDKMMQSDARFNQELIMSHSKDVRDAMTEGMKSAGLKAPKPPENRTGDVGAPRPPMPLLPPRPVDINKGAGMAPPQPSVQPKPPAEIKGDVKSAPPVVVAPKAPEKKK
jgi:hypothetical protein